ncbi:MAG TPA: 6-carboxytetrahydropterin synthase [Bryobacteraceae bacterium]|nr:6-carboxytetrahydropterin synthase [Bryobacteraceae bacterium]
MTTLTRRYRFASSHRLHSPKLSEEENCQTYGKCNNPWGHGHDYVLEVTVGGPVHPGTGRVVSPALLDGYVRENVLEAFDHRDMNRDIAAFAERVPTAENIAAVIRQMLERGWSSVFNGAVLHRIRIEETRRNSVELRNE